MKSLSKNTIKTQRYNSEQSKKIDAAAKKSKKRVSEFIRDAALVRADVVNKIL